MTQKEVEDLRRALSGHDDCRPKHCSVDGVPAATLARLLLEREKLLDALRALHAMDGEELAMFDPTSEYLAAVMSAGRAIRFAEEASGEQK